MTTERRVFPGAACVLLVGLMSATPLFAADPDEPPILPPVDTSPTIFDIPPEIRRQLPAEILENLPAPTTAPAAAEPVKPVWQPVADDADLVAEMQVRLELTDEQKGKLNDVQAERQRFRDAWDRRNAARLEAQRKRISDAKDDKTRDAQEKVLERILRTRENIDRRAYKQAMEVLPQDKRDKWNGLRLSSVVLNDVAAERLDEQQVSAVLEAGAEQVKGYEGVSDVGEVTAYVRKLTLHVTTEVLTEEQHAAYKRRKDESRRQEQQERATLRGDSTGSTSVRRGDPRDASRESQRSSSGTTRSSSGDARSSGDPRDRARER